MNNEPTKTLYFPGVDKVFIAGSIPRIRFTILLRRKLSYHLIQTYLPSSLFVFVSWLSFLIPAGSIPERLGCCMTTLLTLTAMFAAVRYCWKQLEWNYLAQRNFIGCCAVCKFLQFCRHNAPNVSYVKALDIWMIACIIFVFLTLLVHTVIFKLVRMMLCFKNTLKLFRTAALHAGWGA